MKISRFLRLSRLLVLPLCAVCLFPFSSVRAADPDVDAMPENLGRGLRELVAWHIAQPKTQTAAERKALLAKEVPAAALAQTDSEAKRTVVSVKLDGTQPLAAVRATLESLGAKVTGEYQNPAGLSGSSLTARLPLDRAVDAAKAPGVFSIALVRKPMRHAGRVTSQGVGVLHSDAVNSLGYDGKGITVGVLSDSYDVTSPHANLDVQSDDLPGPGNPAGRTQPVKVLVEGANDGSNEDEGRAMLQIIHDVAPGAALAFASVGDSPDTFAASIRSLRGSANCDVMVDDISFLDEPFFFDGPIAQAIADVVRGTSLNGRKALFYSASGNTPADGGAGFLDDFRPVADGTARVGLPKSNLRLGQVPSTLTAGGFHNFEARANKPAIISQTLTVYEAATICLQWDDPFLPGKLTTDYNLLIFDADGNYLPKLSGTDNNFSTAEALEIIDLSSNDATNGQTYQLAITRRNAGTQTATHLRYVATTATGGYNATPVPAYNQPTIFGHVAAPGADGVAAYAYSDPAHPESFDSPGPVTIYFDAQGNRLAAPEVRLSPTMAAPDDVDTSFFPAGSGNDDDNDGFPNFLGTSAAAPHAAGVAALLLQAAGGPGSLNETQVRSLLETTARAHDLDPSFSKAQVADTDGAGVAVLTAAGDNSNNAADDKKFFELTFAGPDTRRLRKVVIDLAPANLRFDPSSSLGFPFIVNKAVGVSKTDDITATFGGDNSTLTLLFMKTAFAPGASIRFGVDRDDATSGAGGNSADLLAGATVNIRTLDDGGATKLKGSGTFQNDIGSGYSVIDGYGLIDAQAAVNKLLTSGAP